VLVSAATKVELSGNWIHDIDGPGIEIDGFDLHDGLIGPGLSGFVGKASVNCDFVLVDGALGQGVIVWGADLLLAHSMMRATRTTAAGDVGHGISVDAAAFPDPELLATDPVQALSGGPPSTSASKVETFETERAISATVAFNVRAAFRSCARAVPETGHS
jgi:hypothetical protein